MRKDVSISMAGIVVCSVVFMSICGVKTQIVEDYMPVETPTVVIEEVTKVPTAKIVEEKETVELTKPVNQHGWYSDEFLELNMAIKDYADQFVDFDFHGVKFDGLAVMAQANTESAYMMDPTKTLTALYPSKFVDITSEEDIKTLNVAKVWSNPDALNGTYVKMPYWDYDAGPFYAWSTDDGVFEQGPLQQRGTTNIEALGHANSELDILNDACITAEVSDRLYGYEAVAYCTGSDTLKYKLGDDYYGDRWSIADNCKIWTESKKSTLNELWDEYYSTCGYIPSKEEYLAILAYAHWIPEVVKGNLPEKTARFYGFAYDGAWFDISKQVASPESLAIIREHVLASIDENRAMHYESYYTKEEAMQFTEMALSAGSTSSAKYSVPWQIFNELVDKGIVDSSTIVEHPSYGYQHAMKYAIEYLYAYEMLEVLLMEGY